MEQLAGKVAVVTGGASGIGRAMAGRFGAEGMRLVLADVEEAALVKAVGELKDAGIAAIGVLTDVSDASAVEHLAERTLAEFGAVHVVCNNAGVSAGGRATDVRLDSWHWVLGVNLWGVIHGVRTFLPLLLDQDEGHIVNTASSAGLGGTGVMGPYGTSKFAVLGLSESLFHELSALGTQVGVSVLCPGFVKTQIADAERNRPSYVEALPETSELNDARRAGRDWVATGVEPSEIADAVTAALYSKRFFIPTHEKLWLSITGRRLAWMLGGPPPVVDVSEHSRP